MWAKIAANFWPMTITAFWGLIYIGTAVSLLAWLYSRLELAGYRALSPNTALSYRKTSAGLGKMVTWVGLAGFAICGVLIAMIFGTADYWKHLYEVLNGRTTAHDLVLILMACSACAFIAGIWLYLGSETRT